MVAEGWGDYPQFLAKAGATFRRVACWFLSLWLGARVFSQDKKLWEVMVGGGGGKVWSL